MIHHYVLMIYLFFSLKHKGYVLYHLLFMFRHRLIKRQGLVFDHNFFVELENSYNILLGVHRHVDSGNYL